MANEVLKYKNYDGSVEFSLEDGCLFGRILFICDRVVYDGITLEELRKNFEETVDEYIALCEEVGKQPERPCSGQFQVRIPPHQHRDAVAAAYRQGVSLNELVKSAISEQLTHTNEVHHIHEHRIRFVSTETYPILTQGEDEWPLSHACH